MTIDKRQRLKQNAFLGLIILLLIGVGFSVLLGLPLSGTTGSGFHRAEGAARLIGVVPIALAVLLVMGMKAPAKKNSLRSDRT